MAIAGVGYSTPWNYSDGYISGSEYSYRGVSQDEKPKSCGDFFWRDHQSMVIERVLPFDKVHMLPMILGASVAYFPSGFYHLFRGDSDKEVGWFRKCISGFLGTIVGLPLVPLGAAMGAIGAPIFWLRTEAIEMFKGYTSY